MLSTEGRGLSTHTAGLYGAGAGLGVVGVAGCPGLSSGAELQGLTPGVLGEMGVVGSTCKHYIMLRNIEVSHNPLHKFNVIN